MIALAKHPMLNAHLDETTQEIVRYGYVNLGIAMDTDNGLIVPVVKDVQAKGLLQLAAELSDLADRTRAGKVKPEELKGSTFSITNAGNAIVVRGLDDAGAPTLLARVVARRAVRRDVAAALRDRLGAA